MPRRVRRAVLTSLAFLGIGVATGLYAVWGRLLGWPWPPMIVSAHTHTILVGGLFLFILGIADWMLPRPGKGTFQEAPSGPPNAAYWHLAIGTAVRYAAEISPFDGAWPIVSACGATLQAGGLAAMIWMLKGRVGVRKAAD